MNFTPQENNLDETLKDVKWIRTRVLMHETKIDPMIETIKVLELKIATLMLLSSVQAVAIAIIGIVIAINGEGDIYATNNTV